MTTSRKAVAKRLAKYRAKRDLSRTSEPSGTTPEQTARAETTATKTRAKATRRKAAVKRGTAKKTAARATKGAGATKAARAPKGAAATKRAPRSKPKFVVQKHDASHLHFDLRLENEGVMKSWAVPKGPSVDPKVKRLAMQVEDHPVEYNTFEGTIPEGEYGGGTVMLWDRGTYTADKAVDGDDEAAVREGLRKGELKFTLNGERLQGSYVLVRTRGDSRRPQWLLIKHRDEHARPGSDIVAEEETSVSTGRTMDEIAEGRSRVWRSNRPAKTRRKSTAAKRPTAKRATAKRATAKRATAKRATAKRATAKRATAKRAAKATGKSATASGSTAKSARAAKRQLSIPSAIRPMLATPGRDMPEGEGWTYEPKYDGIRVLAFATPGDVRLITRNGNDKTRQFPEVAKELAALVGRSKKPLVVDGEIVALRDGEPGRFQELQSRMHVTNERIIEGYTKSQPVALMVFDILVDGDDVLLAEPWSVRRKRLERRISRTRKGAVRLAPSSEDGAEMLAMARKQGWEGLIAKRIDAPYKPGERSKSWQKVKLENQQEFVIGGYTEPRRTRERLGAILLGYYKDGEFVYAGHTGGGFSRKSLEEVYRRLKPLERDTPPFSTKPRTNETPHWVDPKVVAEVRFNEWTREGKLRQPIFLGLRDDKKPRSVHRET